MVSIIFLGLNDVGEEIYEWLTDHENVNVLALLTEREQLTLVKKLEPDLLICGGFRHIIPSEILEVPEKGAINFHKAYLPYNRGANPNVWSIIEENPAGVTLHYMTEELDAGPVIDRRKVEVKTEDNARTLYERMEREQVMQFKENWDEIKSDQVSKISQEEDKATEHRKSDFVDLWELDLDKKTRIGDLIDRLRALTFPPYKNAYFEEEGEKYYVEINVTKEGDREDKQKSGKKVPTYSEEDFGG